MGALSCYKIVSRGAQEGCITRFKASMATTCMINISDFLSKVVLANLYLSISSICLAVDKASTTL